MGLDILKERKPTDETVVIDSNILVYTFDLTDKVKHEKARKLLAEIQQSPANYVACLQNIREFASVLIRKNPKIKESELYEYLDIIQNSLNKVLNDNEEDVRKAVELNLSKGIPFWDGLLIATIERHGIKQIYTENVKDFQKCKTVTALNPLG